MPVVAGSTPVLLGRRSHSAVRGQPRFSPLSLPLLGWFDFSLASSLYTDTGLTTLVAADGDLIKGVRDLSGQGNNLTQATTGPVYKTSIQNGRSVARFSAAVGEWLSSATPASTAQPVTAFAVAKVTSVAASRPIMGAGITSLKDFVYLRFSTGVASMYFGATLAGTGNPAGAWHQFTALANNTSSLIRIDGTENVTGAGGTNALTGLGVGGEVGDSAKMLGDIGEVIFCSGDQTAAFTAVETYFKTRWGTP